MPRKRQKTSQRKTTRLIQLNDYLNDIDFIHAYLNNELSKELIIDFENKLATDHEFAAQYQFIVDIESTLHREKLKETIEKAHQRNTSSKKKWIWMSGVAASVALVLTSWFFIGRLDDKEALTHHKNNQEESAPSYPEKDTKEVYSDAETHPEDSPEQATSLVDPSSIRQKDHQGETFVINAQKGGRIKSKFSGSTIEVPQGAFVDMKGNQVSGNVSIVYKEIRSPEQIAYSTLATNFIENKENYFLNSSGIFDIKAYYKGKPIQIQKNKSLSVAYVINDDVPQLQFLEWKNNAWKRISAFENQHSDVDEFLADDPEQICYTPLLNEWCMHDTLEGFRQAVAEGKKAANSIHGIEYEKVPNLNMTTFEERFKDFNYQGTSSRAGDSDFLNISLLNQSKGMKGKIELVVEDAIGLNPELSALEGIHWEYNTTKDNTLQAEHLGKKWTDVRVNYQETSQQFSLELKGLEEKVVIPVVPVFINKVATKDKEEESHKKFKRYKNILKKRAAAFNANLKEEKKKRLAEKFKEYKCFWNYSRPFMKSKELCLPAVEWKNYFNRNKNMMNFRYDSLSKQSFMKSNINFSKRELRRIVKKFNHKIALRKFVTTKPKNGTFQANTKLDKRKYKKLKISRTGTFNIAQLYKAGLFLGVNYQIEGIKDNSKIVEVSKVYKNGLLFKRKSVTLPELLKNDFKILVRTHDNKYFKSSWVSYDKSIKNQNVKVSLSPCIPQMYYNQ